MEESLLYALICVYFLPLVFSLIMLYMEFKENGAEKKLRFFVILALVGFLFVRETELVVLLYAQGNLPFVLNRVAILFFLTAFTDIVVYWIEIASFTINAIFAEQAISGDLLTGSRGFIAKRFGPLRIALFFLYLYTFISLILTLYLDDHSSRICDDINIIILASYFLVLSIGFVVFGSKLSHRIKQNLSVNITSGVITSDYPYLKLITLLYGASSVCFLFRVIMYSYRPIVGSKSVPEALFYILGYAIPEIPPTLIVLLTMRLAARTQFGQSSGNYAVRVGSVEYVLADSDDDALFLSS